MGFGTLHRALNKNWTSKKRRGPETVLEEKEEAVLVSWLFDLARKGFPRKKDDLRSAVGEYMKKFSGRKNPFVDGIPGRKWYTGFLNRHPEISVRTSEFVSKASAVVSEKDIRGWFRAIKEELERLEVLDAFEDPRRILNGDETGFPLAPGAGKVLAPRGTKCVSNVALGNEKENITVMNTFGADGSMAPPHIVYPYVRIPLAVQQSVPADPRNPRSNHRRRQL